MLAFVAHIGHGVVQELEWDLRCGMLLTHNWRNRSDGRTVAKLPLIGKQLLDEVIVLKHVLDGLLLALEGV